MNHKLLNLRNIAAFENNIIRWNLTHKFVQNNINSEYTVLDIGDRNKFGMKMAEEFHLNYTYTKGDLDTISWYPTISRINNVIFCFEVMEHLMNPLLFLTRLLEYCNRKTKIFVSYPQNPCFFKTPTHFHEFKDEEFYTLIHAAGFKIVEHQILRRWHKTLFYFTGIRPFIRFLCILIGLSKRHLYILMPEKK